MPFITKSDGSVVYRTDDLDTVSMIAANFFGSQAGGTEAIFEANPGLAARGPILTAGIEIKMPPKPTASKTPVINLFD